MLEQTGVADTISAELRQLVTTRANGNCEYCQSPESFATERFNPRQQRWQEHFAWSDNHLRIIGLTPIGRATLRLLHLNRNSLLHLRKALIAINAHPSKT